jgi:preprotein translocase subunit SecD
MTTPVIDARGVGPAVDEMLPLVRERRDEIRTGRRLRAAVEKAVSTSFCTALTARVMR